MIDGPGTAAAPQLVSLDATITGNTIGTAAAANSGSSSGDTITINSNGGSFVRTLIENNELRQYANLAGINLTANDGPTGSRRRSATTRSRTRGSSRCTGCSSGPARPAAPRPPRPAWISAAPARRLKNTLFGSGAGGGTDIRVRQLANTTVRLPGYLGPSNSIADVNTFLIARNDAGGVAPTASSTVSGPGFIGTGTCSLPSP